MTAPTTGPSEGRALALTSGPRRALDGFGRAVRSTALHAAPADVSELSALLARASSERLPVAMRGSGRSYGDAALNAGGLVLSTHRLDRALSWDPVEGVFEAEPGLTIEGLWRRTIEDGYWPAVVPGTAFPTLGGCVAMNIHGKNHFRAGNFGQHVLELDLVTPTGETLTCSPTQHPEVFHAVIGGFGMLGVVTRVKLRLKKVESGFLSVRGYNLPNLDALFDNFAEQLPQSDYLVGWVDAFARGDALGRAQVHRANYVPADADPEPGVSLHVERQGIPNRFFGVIPRGLMWRLLKPWVHDPGMRLVNWAKFTSSRLFDDPNKPFLQSHVAFAFLLDYVPRWREAYGRHGFIQVQPFVPKEAARDTFRDILTLCQQRDLVPYLAVFKRHRPDDFLLSHALDGFSLAMDFRVTAANRDRVWALGQEIGDRVVAAGGRFYFAKDAVARADQVAASFGPERLEQFFALKRRLDPAGVLSSELSRRVVPALAKALGD